MDYPANGVAQRWGGGCVRLMGLINHCGFGWVAMIAWHGMILDVHSHYVCVNLGYGVLEHVSMELNHGCCAGRWPLSRRSCPDNTRRTSSYSPSAWRRGSVSPTLACPGYYTSLDLIVAAEPESSYSPLSIGSPYSSLEESSISSLNGLSVAACRHPSCAALGHGA
jgi:hypothetical protein